MTGLRIIAGKARGRRLISVPGDTTRPITDRTKESLFNILGADIAGSKFLDLFAGTGSVGIEALSRDAAYVRFIDINKQAIKTIRKNLELTGFRSCFDILQRNALTLLGTTPDVHFDYIYIAPPQYHELWKQAIMTLDKTPEWLSDDAWVIAQIHPIEYETLSNSLVNFIEFDQRKYGSTLLVFYERQ